MNTMREATIIYAPAAAEPCVLGYLNVTLDDKIEWEMKKDVSISEDDAEVIAGLCEYFEGGAASMGGMALLEWMASTFSHTIQVEAAASQALQLTADQAVPY